MWISIQNERGNMMYPQYDTLYDVPVISTYVIQIFLITISRTKFSMECRILLFEFV